MSRLDWILPKLKEKYGGPFYITPAVKFELIDRPLKVKRFKFEALQSMKLIRDGVLEVYKDVPQKKALELKNLANSSFKIKNKSMDVLQAGEVESIASALEHGGAIVMDERTLRLFIENNKEMRSLLQHRFKQKVTPNTDKMKLFSSQLRGITVIRSIELISVAYKLGLLDSYVPKMRTGRNLLLDAVLWAAKTNGCAVTQHEIEEMKQILLK